MIFKQLFRSKHQSPDPQVRIQAIENLNKQDPQQKSILHELAFNDSDVNVSLAALQRLDSFALWHKMSEIAKNERIQKKSQQIVESTLFDENNSALPEGERKKFVQESRDNRLIEKFLTQKWVLEDTKLAMSLLQKANKPQLTEKLLFETHNLTLQKSILQTFSDNSQQRKLLNKLLKKTQSAELQQVVNDILRQWVEAEEAPKVLELQIKMVLSRLLALKDQDDLEVIEQKQAQLTQEYQTLAKGFDCLTEIKREEIENKYADLSQRLSRSKELLRPKWQALQAEKVLNDQTDTLVTEIEAHLIQVSEQLNSRVDEIVLNEVQEFKQATQNLLEKLHALTNALPKDSAKVHRRLEQLNNQLVANANTLSSLPEFQQALVEGQKLLNRFSELDLPNDSSQIEAAEEYLREQKQAWRTTLGAYQGQIPAPLMQSWQGCVTKWQQATKGLKDKIHKDLARCRSKVKAVESLIRQGKYKAAMGLYQKVQTWFDALPEKQQSQVERSYLSVKEQIENLKDWQDYIAAPRKPALLEEAEALVTSPLEVNAQASTIKSLRNRWNSLGKTDTESDHALNEAFEAAIEKAFAPCRAHYDQQQLAREQNLAAKNQLLTEIENLAQSVLPSSELSKALKRLQQEWRSIGEVDFKLRDEVYAKYQKLTAPIKDKVSAFYQDNAEQKRKLVEKAQQLSELEEVAEAIEQAKALQEKWKTIEHAGKQAEKELWAAFRQANDSLFAKRAAASQAHKTQIKEQIDSAKAQLLVLEEALEVASEKSAVQSALKDKAKFVELLLDLPSRERSVLEKKLQALDDKQSNKLTEIQKSIKSQQYQTLFDVLKSWQQGSDKPSAVNDLAKQWQVCFDAKPNQKDRHELSIKMEIVANAESPKKDMEQRKTIQMQLMAQKLQSGDSADLLVLLKDWISVGTLSKTDMILLKRIEPLFIN